MDQTTQPAPAPMPARAALQGPVELLKSSIAFFKTNKKLFISLGLVVVVLSFLNGVFAAMGGIGFIFSFIFALAGVVFSILAQIGIIRTNREIEGGIVKGVKEIYKESAGLFWSIIWVSIITSLVVMGGMMLLVIPGIMMAVLLSFVLYAVVLDGKRGMQAMSFSYHLVKGNWWGVFLRQIAMVLMLYIPFAIVTGIISAIFGLNAEVVNPVSSLVWGTVFSFISVCILFPITVNYTYRLYKSLKEQKGEPAPGAEKKGLFIGFGIVGIAAPIIIGIITVIVAASFAGTLRDRQIDQSNLIDQLPAAVSEVLY